MTDKRKRYNWIAYIPKQNSTPTPGPGNLHVLGNLFVFGIVLTGETNYPPGSVGPDDLYVQ
jgi:hypothetical protein